MCKKALQISLALCLSGKEKQICMCSVPEGYFFPEYFQPAIVRSTVVKAQAWKAAVHTQDRKSLLFLKLLCVPQDFPAKQHSMLQLCKGVLLLVLQMKNLPSGMGLSG